jgi:hypothetical protein
MDESNPLRNFTILGRLWAVICLFVGVFGFVAYVVELVPTLPAGNYPVIVLVMPIALATLVLYALGYGFLRMCGFRLRKPPAEDE